MASVSVSIGEYHFTGTFEHDDAPLTSARFMNLLPFSKRLIQARWSGEAGWIPLGNRVFDIPDENLTSYPAPGHVLIYKGGHSEAELLIAYGATRFASKLGQHAGSHFLTLVEGQGQLPSLGQALLYGGALDIRCALQS